MDKKILKEKLTEVKNQLRTNAKDTHFFDKLIEEALSLKGQIGVDALACGFPQSEIVDTIEEDTYRLIEGVNASAYQTKGGFTVVAQNHLGLGQLFAHIVQDKEEALSLDGEYKENYDSFVTALAYTLNIPLLAATDQEFMFHMATETVKYLQKQVAKAEAMELQEETPKENAEFEEATLALETLKEELAKA